MRQVKVLSNISVAHLSNIGVAAIAALLILGSLASPGSAQTPTVLHSFDGTDGTYPEAGLVQAANGYLYGVTYSGGANGAGTVFKITPSGTFTTLYSFCSLSGCADGNNPYGSLIQATNGDLYGTTAGGGVNSDCENNVPGCGTIFKITPSGALTTLHSFCSETGCADGYFPVGALVQADNGDIYGTTSEGGIGGNFGPGTIFKMTPGGMLTTIYSFCYQAGCPDGRDPYGGLIQASNGYLYGTTSGGGANGSGTIFKITASGTLTTLYSFCSQSGCLDGASPVWGLMQANSGNIYGTTGLDGADGFGTLFQITPSGTLTTLHSFCSQPGCADGYSVYGGLIQATDQNLYGATVAAGSGGYCDFGCGTLFKITPSGTLTTLYTFCSQTQCADGANPWGPLVEDTNGALFGTTSEGGANGYGTVFKLSVGLGRFVEALPNIGKVGATVTILGSLLSGTTSVSFNHIAAAFTVVSANEVTATIPDGATTGEIRLIVPGGVTLLSNKPFQVVQ